MRIALPIRVIRAIRGYVLCDLSGVFRNGRAYFDSEHHLNHTPDIPREIRLFRASAAGMSFANIRWQEMNRWADWAEI
jgi:hypothetical protein